MVLAAGTLLVTLEEVAIVARILEIVYRKYFKTQYFEVDKHNISLSVFQNIRTGVPKINDI